MARQLSGARSLSGVRVGSGAQAGLRAAATITPSYGPFPCMVDTTMLATSIDAGCFSYQECDFDIQRKRVLFYPYGVVNHGGGPYYAHGKMLSFNILAAGGFSDPASWTIYDIPAITGNPLALAFGGGFIDAAQHYVYLCPGFATSVDNQNLAANPVTVQVDLTADLSTSGAYAVFDTSVIRAPSLGFGGCVGADGSAYFLPGRDLGTGQCVGKWLRYKPANGAYTNAAAWTSFDMAANVDPAAVFPQSAISIGKWLYQIPFVKGNSHVANGLLVRFDTTAAFTSASSYQTFDLADPTTGLPSKYPDIPPRQFTGFTGGVQVGKYMVLIPWRYNDDLPLAEQTNVVAVLFDTTAAALSDLTAWQAIDLTRVDPSAGGYQLGWMTKDGFVSFVPTRNYTLTTVGSLEPGNSPPLITWDRRKPFTDPASWMTYPVPRVPSWGTGATYDPKTHVAWTAAYGPKNTGSTAPQQQLSYPVSRVTSSPRDPTDGRGLVLWLEADAITGLTDGQAVASWPDQSGLAHTAVQATSGNRPLYKTNILNGLPVVRADGVASFLALPALADSDTISLTVMAVVNPVSATGTNQFLFDAAAGRWTLGLLGTVAGRLGYQDVGVTWHQPAKAALGAQILTWVFDVPTLSGTVYRNGVQIARSAYAATALSGALALFAASAGATGFAACDLAAFAVWTTALPQAVRATIERTWAAKYGLAVN